MSDETYRRYHAGKHDNEDFTASDEENRKMKHKQKELDKYFEGEGPEKAKKLRSKTRYALEDMGE